MPGPATSRAVSGKLCGSVSLASTPGAATESAVFWLVESLSAFATGEATVRVTEATLLENEPSLAW